MPTINAILESAREHIRELDYQYYTLAIPLVSDEEYDRLLRDLRHLEEFHPTLPVSPSSPTQRIGETATDGFATVPHTNRMYSLDNTYNLEDLTAWIKNLKPGTSITAEHKIDGIAMTLKYEDGVLVQAVTRGNGFEGDDVTSNARTIHSIPLQLHEGSRDTIEIRGEVVMPIAVFKHLNANGHNFANPRNATAGTMKSHDPSIVYQRKLVFIAHGTPNHSAYQTLQGFRTDVQSLGFLVSPVQKVQRLTIEEVVNKMKVDRSDLPYETDGLVFKVENMAQQQKMGCTSKSPRWAIAFKFPATEVQTEVTGITWQTGRTGVITPVAELTPVWIDGSMVSRATLHNHDEIIRLGLSVGDIVIVKKAGEIIPAIVKVADPSNLPVVPLPMTCSCGAPIQPLEGVGICCGDQWHCPAVIIHKIRWFAAPNQMDIAGLGIQTITDLVKAGKVNTVSDLYHLTSEDLYSIPRMGKKGAKKILASIEKSKGQPLNRVIAALGIQHVGHTTSRALAKKFNSLLELQDDRPDQFKIGSIVNRAIWAYMDNNFTCALVDALRASGVGGPCATPVASEPRTGPLSGKKVVVTGSFDDYNRNQVGELIESLGGSVVGSVSKKTDLLIAGAKAGSKLAKAKKLGVDVWSLNTLEALTKD